MRFLCIGLMFLSWNIKKQIGRKLKSTLCCTRAYFSILQCLWRNWIVLEKRVITLSLRFVVRKMPCTLPSDLLPFLIEHGLFPEVPLRQRKRYWNHLRECSSPMAQQIPSNDLLPLFLWADAANYWKDESVLAICIGCTLDDRKNSLETHFPLVICREDPRRQESNSFSLVPNYPQQHHLP